MNSGEATYSPRQKAARIMLLAVLYFVFGHLSFLAQVDNVIVTPVLFASEGIALAFALRYGTWAWPGIFLGQLALALTRGLPLLPASSIAATNSLEAVIAVALFRMLRLDARLPRARDLGGLLALVFLVLQPFSATTGNAILWSAGLIADGPKLHGSWLDWWSGNSLGQMIVAPALLAMFARTRNPAQLAGDIVIPMAILVPAVIAEQFVLQRTGVSSLVVLLVPIFIALAVYRGMVAVCTAALAVAAAALYATSHNFGPFVREGQAAILDLNVFLVGLAVGGQFLSIFLRQLERQRATENELRAAQQQLEAEHRRDLENKLKTSLQAAAVAHEINQPLSAILLGTKLALEEKRDGREALSDVAKEAQRVVTTIEKMKTLMRNVQTEHRAIDLSAVVRSALLYNKTMLSRHDVTACESGLNEARMIMGDDEQLQLAITNILRNAAEAIDQSAADRREISVDLADDNNAVILTIADSGPGWSGAEPAETPLTTTKKGGTGIGLYVARTAMENHRGKISFGKSAVGGAEVKMFFPRIGTQQAAATGTAALPRDAGRENVSVRPPKNCSGAL